MSLKPLSELLSPAYLEARDVAKHNRLLKRLKKEFKKMPYADITPHETMAQVTMAKAQRDRNKAERRKWKK